MFKNSVNMEHVKNARKTGVLEMSVKRYFITLVIKA